MTCVYNSYTNGPCPSSPLTFSPATNRALYGTGGEVFYEYRYDNSVLGVQSTYAKNLEANIQKNCGVSVGVQ